MRDKILIADSNEANREILVELFEEDYKVIEAETGEQVIDIFRREHDNLSAVIMDYSYPDMEGTAVLEATNNSDWFDSFPIMVLSEDSSFKAEKSAYKAGAMDFSRKPFDSALVKKRLEKLAELYAAKEKLSSMGSASSPASVGNYSADAQILLGRYEKLIELMGNMTEFKNPESHSHVKRIKGLTKILAEGMAKMYPEYNLDAQTIRDITTASALHDIGKIAIPDTVLLKPGRLTDEEYEYMKSHTLRGVEILDAIEGVWDEKFDKIVREVVRSHHEKYDGGGYPEGLKGDEIPIGAQIVALADTYDALVNDRIYKKAYPKDVAFNKINMGDCGIFPPKILECFKVCRERMEAWENDELDLGI